MVLLRQEVFVLIKDKKTNELNIKEYSIISNIIYCLNCTVTHYPLLLLWCAFAVFANVSLPIITTYLPKIVIDEITLGGSINHVVFVVLSLTLSIAVLLGFKRFTERYVYHHKFKMNSYYMRIIANKGMTTDYCNQEKEQFRKLQSESFSSCNGNYSALTQVYDTNIALLSNALGFIVYFGMLVKLSILIELFIIITTLVSYFLNKKILKWVVDNNKEKISYQQKTNYINDVSGDIKSAKDIRLYNMFVWLENVYNTNIKGLKSWYKRYTAKIFKTTVFDGILSLMREGVAYIYLLYLVLNARISVADFVLYFGVITGFSVWLRGILGQINSLNRISLSVNYLRAYLEYPESYNNQDGIETSDLLTLPKTIELRNVCYHYDGANENTLKNINLKINPSEHLAIVGLNGAGKTTLVKLICGLCNPTEGEVLYDGINVKKYNRRSYYKLFSAVFQQFSILPVTIEEIVAESVTENVDSKKVELILKQAGLWDKIIVLPKGVKSDFGKTIYDDGVEFSGGEIQKLLLARALYKESPVMILDEPTAALDPISESCLYETYNEIMKDRSTIFISHRLASTRFCNRILLLENGSVCEEGTHESLLSQKGKYYDLFETQAKYYRDNNNCKEGQYE